MRYLLLIVEEEGVRDAWSEEERGADMGRWGTYTEDLQQAGVLVAAEALQPSSTATTVRKEADGGTLTTDGPFAETKEIVNGFYLVDVDDLDQAVHWAERLPTLGAVEVRPVIDFSEYQ